MHVGRPSDGGRAGTETLPTGGWSPDRFEPGSTDPQSPRITKLPHPGHVVRTHAPEEKLCRAVAPSLRGGSRGPDRLRVERTKVLPACSGVVLPHVHEERPEPHRRQSRDPRIRNLRAGTRQVQAHQEGDTEGDGQGAAHYERRLTEHRSIAGRWDGSRSGASLERPYNGLAEKLPRHPDVEKPRVRESRGLRPERAGVVELLVVVPHGLGAPPGSLVAPRNRLPVGDPGVLEIEHRVLGQVVVAVAKVPAGAQRAMD